MLIPPSALAAALSLALFASGAALLGYWRGRRNEKEALSPLLDEATARAACLAASMEGERIAVTVSSEARARTAENAARAAELRAQAQAEALAAREEQLMLQLATREAGLTAQLATREAGLTAQLATREAGLTAHLAAREAELTAQLAAREAGLTAQLAQREGELTVQLVEAEERRAAQLSAAAADSSARLASREAEMAGKLAVTRADLAECRAASASAALTASAELAALTEDVELVRAACHNAVSALAVATHESAEANGLTATWRERQEALSAFAHALAEDRDPQSLEGEAACVLAELLGADLVGVFALESDGARAWLRAGAGWRPDQIGQLGMYIGEGTLAAHAVAAGAPVVVERALEETRFMVPPVLVTEGAVTCAIVRIPGAPLPVGLLCVCTRTERSFSAEDTAFMVAVAAHLGVVAVRSRDLEALRVREETFRNAVAEPVMVADETGRVMDASASCERIFEASPRSLQGRALQDLLMPHRDPGFDLWAALLQERARPNGGVKREMAARRFDEAIAPVRVRARVSWTGGRWCYSVCLTPSGDLGVVV
jgi:GAF domain-containing protein